MSLRTLPLLLILLTPLFGIFFGIFIAYHHEIPVIAFSSNMIAVVIGIPLALLLASRQISFQQHWIHVSLLALVLMTASLLSLNIAGVHRWISIGSMNINISMVLVPLILYLINTSLDSHPFLSTILTSMVSLIHVLQPDAGQATAFGCAAIIIFLLAGTVPFATRLIGIISMVIGIMLAWRQPDSLPAVEHVEHILHLATNIGVLGVVGVVLSIVSLLAPIFYTLQHQMISRDNYILAIAFIVYIAAGFCVTELGNYPVPVVGAGASPILGWYVIVGLLCPIKVPNR